MIIFSLSFDCSEAERNSTRKRSHSYVKYGSNMYNRLLCVSFGIFTFLLAYITENQNIVVISYGSHGAVSGSHPVVKFSFIPLCGGKDEEYYENRCVIY